MKILIHTVNRKAWVDCRTIAECVAAWESARDAEGIGASGMMKNCGNVKIGRKIVATVSYNGRVWAPGEWQPGQEPLTDEEISELNSRGEGAK